jgi:1-acyl-sn-glycerol-3-phosphate acyltransferase
MPRPVSMLRAPARHRRASASGRVVEKRPRAASPRASARLHPAELPGLLLAVLRLGLCVLVTIACIGVVLIVAIGDPTGRRAHRVARFWARLNLWLCGVTVDVDGRERLDPSTAYVFMSNHRSASDILALIVALENFELRWVAKAELRRIPGFGAALRATKQIFVDRADHARAVASLAAARRRIHAGASVVFFPEGHRSAGPLLPFKKGGFVFAIETGAPIVPIGIQGPRLLDARGPLRRRHGVVRVVIRPPVATADLEVADRDGLLTRVRRSIVTAMHTPRRLVPERRRRTRRLAARAGVVVHPFDARHAS